MGETTALTAGSGVHETAADRIKSITTTTATPLIAHLPPAWNTDIIRRRETVGALHTEV
jgi:hypothetical protein